MQTFCKTLLTSKYNKRDKHTGTNKNKELNMQGKQTSLAELELMSQVTVSLH